MRPGMRLPTYIGKCCREWVLTVVGGRGTCGLCGEVPTYLRPDTFYDDQPEDVDPQ